MSVASPPSFILRAIDALKTGDRDYAAGLLRQELRGGAVSGERWQSVHKLALQIGEIEIALEAARRYAATEPLSLERLLTYWAALAANGRTEEALAAARRLPPAALEHPSVLHFLGTTAGEKGNFAKAEEYFRRSLAKAPMTAESWFALAMIKKFAPGDPDLAEMERQRPLLAKAPPSLRARFLYGLAKAWDDAGDLGRAFELYTAGAELRRRETPWEPGGLQAFADRLMRDFRPGAIAGLRRSGADDVHAIFVTGLPRSGSTLIEQILTSHSRVSDGGEINLLRAALIPTIDYSLAGAQRYQDRATSREDPWGDIGRAYRRMLDERFSPGALVVDKSLVQSHFMGLLLHALPNARVIWMRRDPADDALSCFRTYFTASLPWSWSLEDIGHFFRIEDQLFAHWTALFPERILPVPYEALVSDPDDWITRILAHLDLEQEDGLANFHKTQRSVRTASVGQVRKPISTERIGRSNPYGDFMVPFWRGYQA